MPLCHHLLLLLLMVLLLLLLLLLLSQHPPQPRGGGYNSLCSVHFLPGHVGEFVWVCVLGRGFGVGCSGGAGLFEL